MFKDVVIIIINAFLYTYVPLFCSCEDAITFGMGFATNALNLPRLIGKDCLVLSDEFNHASIITGLRRVHYQKLHHLDRKI